MQEVIEAGSACGGGGWDLVILDNDGVLVDSEPVAAAVLAGVLADRGHAVGVGEVTARFLGTGISRVRRLVEAETGRALGAGFEDTYHSRLLAQLRRGVSPVPGVIGALDHIPTPTWVASSGSRERVEVSLRCAGLLGRFAGRISCADDVDRPKPAPDVLVHAAAGAGALPARTVVVEDSPAGVEAALAAGMAVVAYAAVTPASLLGAAHATFTEMAQLPLLLDSLAPRVQSPPPEDDSAGQ